ncbi:Ig-like domain-containing protein [Mycobacterium sp. PSTR-4-N]|uniref:Ig-like domain-containing protein n=1 Tax=Mycobacterium sp. PSTR-4-N TaxID=2917745 RepID=UPI001F152D0E|nr:Ig-like domain-containing protein [Mycobacterium sp. PSTR-4-N]MCG7592729.1 Ig-like domain-containing protein [Mycobacterium sp. PSTR-4-N]
MSVGRRTEDVRSSTAARSPQAALAAADPLLVTSISIGKPQRSSGKVSGRITVQGGDGSPLRFTAQPTDQGTVTVDSRGKYTFTPSAAARHNAAASPGADYTSIDFVVTNETGATASGGAGVALLPSNSAPRVKTVVNKGNPATGAITGVAVVTDGDGDAITYSGSGLTSRGSVVVNADGSFVYTPTPAAHAAASSASKRQDKFTLTVDDGHGGTATVAVKVKIVPPGSNKAPEVDSTPFAISGIADADGNVTGYVNVKDPDGFPLSWKLAAGIDPAIGSVTVNPDTGTFSFTPTVATRESAYATAGEDSVRFTVSASDGLATVTVEVNAPISSKAPAPPPPPPPPPVSSWRQVTTPNFAVGATRGWCLKFVDDTVNAPARSATAQLAYERQVSFGNITTGEPPVGVWVPLFFSIGSGQYAGQGHVAWAYNYGGGRMAIRDSETQSGARAVYTNIGQVASWFGSQNVKYLGWSTWVDGRQIVEKVSGTPGGGGGGGGGGATSGTKSGTATVVQLVNVRNDPSTNGPIVAQYSAGQSFNYDSWVIANGYYWLSYVSYSGVRRYVAEATTSGSVVYVRGGVFH